MNDRSILEAEKAYRKFEQKASVIAVDVMKRLKDFNCEVSCDIYKGDGLCVNALTYTRFNLGPNANGPITVRQEYECYYIGCAVEND